MNWWPPRVGFTEADLTPAVRERLEAAIADMRDEGLSVEEVEAWAQGYLSAKRGSVRPRAEREVEP